MSKPNPNPERRQRIRKAIGPGPHAANINLEEQARAVEKMIDQAPTKPRKKKPAK